MDATGRKNGRGAYLCFSGKCLQEAIKNKGLERSFKQAIPKKRYTKIWKRSWSSLNMNKSIIDDQSGDQSRQDKERGIHDRKRSTRKDARIW